MRSVITPSDSEKATEKEVASAKNIRTIFFFIGLFLACFLAASFRVASAKPLWMDEILAVWTARLHPTRMVWSAIYQGSDFSPPIYHVLLHFVISTIGGSYLLVRLPSILSTLVSGLCVFTLLRRYLHISAAAFGMAFALMGLLSAYGEQARPYALVTTCFAVAILLWDDLNQKSTSLWRVCLIAALLATAASLHFYAVLLVPSVALMELLWSALNRRIRSAVWIALFVAGASSFAWLPLIRTITKYNSGDTSSIDYYARPTLGRLTLAYAEVFVFGKRHMLFLLVTFCLLGIAYACRSLGWFAQHHPEGKADSRRGSRSNLYIIALCTTAFPILVFVFSLLVTKTFNTRYVLVTCLGTSFLAACILDQVSELRSVIGPILLAASALVFVGSYTDLLYPGGRELKALDGSVAVLRSATKPYPIVVGEALQYLQLAERVPDGMRSRLVYVTAARFSGAADPTNENQLKRWRSLRPELRIVDPEPFFAQNQRFYLLHTDSSTDLLTNWLLSQNLIDKPQAFVESAWLLEATAPR
jgi:hypothetical protein